MKPLFQRFKPSKNKQATIIPVPMQAIPDLPPEPVIRHESEPVNDGFTDFCRTRVRGGIERRERNDIYEEYSVYGRDAEGRLTCRYYHRYPEHERGFELSDSRILSFDDFNKRLLRELDRGSVSLDEYRECIDRAAEEPSPAPFNGGFTDGERAVLERFFEGMDTLRNREYGYQNGIFRCSCASIVGDGNLGIRCRRPLPCDALHTQIAGVLRESIEGYDLDDLWIMSVYNRLREQCSSVTVTRLTAQWSLRHEQVYLIAAEGFPEVDNRLLFAVADAASISRFGFYSLDFSV